MFAGIAEVAGTTVLLGLSIEVQSVFVWYVMLFPVLLVSLFFLVLFKKREVLYAPSDFKNEQYFVDLMNSKDQKIKEANELIKETMEQLTESAEKTESVDSDSSVISTLKNKLTKIEEKIEEAQINGSTDIQSVVFLSKPVLSNQSIPELLKFYPGGLTKKEIDEKLGGIFALDYYLSKLVEDDVIYIKGDRYIYRSRIFGA